MRYPLFRPGRVLCAAALSLTVGITPGCAADEAESAAQAAAPGAGTQTTSGTSAKFHVVIAGGPLAGTYDVSSDACMASIQKPGSWHATWESDTTPDKGTISSVLVGYDPRPTFGPGSNAMVTFGDEGDTKVLYEVQDAERTITDRGGSATLVFKGKARATSYSDGMSVDGGLMEITVECSKVTRP